MNDQTRIELIETLLNTLDIYREKTDKLCIDQALTGHLQNEISHLMTENEFADWIDMGEFRPELKTINHSFETGRIYNFPQKISLIIEQDKIIFNDPSRDMAGSFELEADDTISKSFEKIKSGKAPYPSELIRLIKGLAKSRTMNHYDNGTHKWFSTFEAEKLFGKEAF